MKGQCLCGAVTIVADGLSGEISACHCDMCRRWSGGIQMGIEVALANIKIKGPVKVYRSSDFAERAWCDTCGSALWLHDVSGPGAQYFELVPGLFDNAADARLTREVYADKCPKGYALAGDHRRVTKAEYEANNPFVSEGVPQ